MFRHTIISADFETTIFTDNKFNTCFQKTSSEFLFFSQAKNRTEEFIFLLCISWGSKLIANTVEHIFASFCLFITNSYFDSLVSVFHPTITTFCSRCGFASSTMVYTQRWSFGWLVIFVLRHINPFQVI